MIVSLLPAPVTAIIIYRVGLLPAARNSPLTGLLVTVTHNSPVGPVCSSCVPLWPRLSSLTSKDVHPLTKHLLIMRILHLFIILTTVLIRWKHWWRWNLSNLKSQLPLHVIDVLPSLISGIHNILTHVKYVLEQLLELAPPRSMVGRGRPAAARSL